MESSWCSSVFRDPVRNNVNSNYILPGLRIFAMPIGRSWDLIGCCLAATMDPVIKGTWCYIVFPSPVSISHAASSALIDEPDLL